MNVTHRLKHIPKELQHIYNIGEEVDIQAIGEEENPNGPAGGQFKFINNRGKEVTIDAVEMFGRGIDMEPK